MKVKNVVLYAPYEKSQLQPMKYVFAEEFECPDFNEIIRVPEDVQINKDMPDPYDIIRNELIHNYILYYVLAHTPIPSQYPFYIWKVFEFQVAEANEDNQNNEINN